MGGAERERGETISFLLHRLSEAAPTSKKNPNRLKAAISGFGGGGGGGALTGRGGTSIVLHLLVVILEREIGR